MKKIFLFLIILLFTTTVYANEIYSINMDIYLDEKGNANITEVWDVEGTDGTEWYKPIHDLQNSKITNFTVSMDGNPLIYKRWNVNESLNAKAGYYGINYVSEGLELCFGKSDFNRHTFVLKYDISNYVFNTNDSQILYATFVPVFQNVNFHNMKVTIRSFYKFPDTLDVWGYGYKGYAYVSDGIISFSNSEDSSMNNVYMVGLVKFPLNTFNTMNTISYFNDFDDVKNTADEGTYEYDYNNYDNSYYDNDSYYNDDSSFWDFLPVGVIALSVGASIFGAGKAVLSSGYGYKGNKEIKKKDTPAFRDIPCNKDIYYANALIYLNNFNYQETNILGAIILKWIRNKKISFIKKQVGILKKETDCLDLTLNPIFENNEEKELFDYMYKASKDGILEPKEFERWAKNHYTTFFNLFSRIKNNEINRLKANNHIYTRTSKEECKKRNVMDDTIYEESKKLLGLKKFLQEFSSIDTKETMEVHIWDHYLMFAYLFGIADKVMKQLKKLYPEVLQQDNFDYNTFVLINSFSTSTVHAASSARHAAESYSSGGGGFSIGGGGGGSFGGGGFSGGGSR